MTTFRKAILISAATLAAAVAGATTWGEAEVTCPLCGTANAFQAIMSYGSYIYQWPSNFQYIFWPATESEFVYSCLGCRFTAYMGDFEKVPADKKEALVAAAKDVHFGRTYAAYTEIPVSERLLAAARTYEVLGRDDAFWCQYYRILAYHFDAEGKKEDAATARRAALGLAEKMLADDADANQDKELLLIAGAMRHYLADDAGALAAFREAQPLTFKAPAYSDEENGNVDAYLNELLAEYVKKIESGEEE